MALKFMAEKEEGSLTSAREICDKFNTPFDTMAKVMQSLNNHEVLKSVKGIKGGYSLEKSLSELSFKELENIIEGKKQDSHCKTKKGYCDLYSLCNIKGPIDRLNFHVNNYLMNLSLEDLLLDKNIQLNNELNGNITENSYE